MNTFLQAFYSAMQTMIKEKYSHDKILETLKPWDQKAKELSLKRDQHAYKEMKFALLHHIAVYETSACYEYQGKSYSVQKGIVSEKSVEYLYTLDLNQDVWDSMKRGSVWNFRDNTDSQFSDFKIYGELKEKDY